MTHPAYKLDSNVTQVCVCMCVCACALECTSARAVASQYCVCLSLVACQEIAFDVLDTCRKIASGELACPELLGSLTPISALKSPTSSLRPSVLRGASFHEAFPSSECAVLQRLLARHVVSKSFAETAPFLSDESGAVGGSGSP